MSAHEPQDQHHDAPVPPVRPVTAPGASRDATPSVRDLLASCAAARTVSTPPADGPAEPPAAGAPAPAEPSRGRDAA
ncbi:hypothetical protein SAMN05216267_10194 [Actinacidiphila rubida]|uniref:Uncharacterized protein n=1 Tax=Actinacidiphila rubida TaxID=310780 RepID=A0A1H8MIP3_9ACTN|nr:hypothetical protein [Actinacidiphila rubida]SEO17265.1 hypothetical protein SAMN05216267_10194 [Actinacidiphila rubida]